MKINTSLPTIKDMYNCTRQNYDYNVIKKYEGNHKNFAVNSKATKKDHYLDESIRLSCSPGPANSANSLLVWFNNSKFQSKRAPKQTYLDQICKRQKKANSPSPNHYNISMQWPKKKDQLKSICEKTNFADTCQYQSEKLPGPGAYNIRTHLSTSKLDKKWTPHLPIKPRDPVAAQNGNYNPCPLEYNTFVGYQLHRNSSHQVIPKKQAAHRHSQKQNKSPGPASYSTVSFWPSKSPNKKEKRNYFNITTKGPSHGVYH